jgi:enoyl-CoA hydratase
MSDDPIYLTRDGDIAEMVLNRPNKHNALNRHIWNTIPALCREIEEDPAIKVLIVRGAGGKAFAAGADISEFPQVHATSDSAKAYHGEIRQAYDALVGLAKPTIAMINGICFGGGCAIALCCDMRYAASDARFCIPPAKLGLTYTLFETKRLYDLVGPAKTKEMLMGAKVIAADEAFTVGLATRVFAPENLEAGTFAFARELAGLSQFTIRGVKAIVDEILQGATDETEKSESLVAQAFDAPDYAEGRDAFLEKRTAKFSYR